MPEPTKTGCVLFPFMGASAGGSHISTFHLAKALRDSEGVDVCIAGFARTSILSQARAFGLKRLAIAGAPAKRRRIFRDVLDLPERVRALRATEAAILHCSDFWSLQSWAPAAKLLGVPVVYHHRDFRRATAANKLVACLTDAVICISEACRANATAITGKPAQVITNPFPAPVPGCGAALRQELEAQWPETSKPKLVGFAANFIARKRPLFFLEVGAELARRDKDVRFVMFGRPREIALKELVARARMLGLIEKIFFAGFRSPAEANFAALDVLVAPALREAFGRTLIEAALVGTPYVATNDAGHAEIFARWGGGRLAPPGASPNAVANIVFDVLANPAAASLDEAQRREIAVELAPPAHASAVARVYEQVLSKNGASALAARNAEMMRDHHAS